MKKWKLNIMTIYKQHDPRFWCGRWVSYLPKYGNGIQDDSMLLPFSYRILWGVEKHDIPARYQHDHTR